MTIVIFISIIFILTGFYVCTHLRPLEEREIISLARKKRSHRIFEYFLFEKSQFIPNNDFKKSMNPDGSFYYLNYKLYDIPSIAASILKYKKHEWIIVAFESEKKIKLIWLNKGLNRESVSLYLSIDDIVQIAKDEKSTTILIFHNHPNSNPKLYDCSKPSKLDISTAEKFAITFHQNGISLIEFVCERGVHHEYFRSISDVFIPQSEIEREINMLNGKSKKENLKLHLQRLF